MQTETMIIAVAIAGDKAHAHMQKEAMLLQATNVLRVSVTIAKLAHLSEESKDQYSRHSNAYTSNDPLSSIAVTASEGDDDDDDGGSSLGAAPDHHHTIQYTRPKRHRHVNKDAL